MLLFLAKMDVSIDEHEYKCIMSDEYKLDKLPLGVSSDTSSKQNCIIKST